MSFFIFSLSVICETSVNGVIIFLSSKALVWLNEKFVILHVFMVYSIRRFVPSVCNSAL